MDIFSAKDLKCKPRINQSELYKFYRISQVCYCSFQADGGQLYCGMQIRAHFTLLTKLQLVIDEL